MAEESRTVRIRFDGTTAGLSRAARQGERDIDRFGESLGRVRSMAGGVAAGAAKIGLALAAVAVKGVLAAVTAAKLVSLFGALAGVVGTASGAMLLFPAVLAAAGIGFGALKLGLSGFGEALSNMGDPAKFAESIKGLAPAAQAAAKAVAGLKPQFDELRTSVQERLFAGLAGDISTVGSKILSGLRTPFQLVAVEANAQLKGIFADFSSDGFQRDIAGIGTQGAFAFNNIIGAARPLLGVLLDVTAVGSTFLDGLTSGAGDAAKRFAAMVSAARESGRLQEIMSQGLSILGDLGKVAGNVGGILKGVFQAADQGGGGLVETLKTGTAAIREFVNSAGGQQALRSFFAATSAIADNLGQVLIALAPAVGPVVAIVGILAVALANKLGQAAEKLAPKIEQFAGFLNDKVIPALRSTGGWVSDTLVPKLRELGDYLQDRVLPVLREVGDKALAGVRSAIDTVRGAIERNRPELDKLYSGFKQAADFIATTVLPLLGPLLKFAFESLGRGIGSVIVIVSTLVNIFNACREAVLLVIRTITAVILGFFGAIVDGAAKAFGWVPGIGPKLQTASDEFRVFRDKVNSWLAGINDRNVTVRATFAGTGGVRLGAQGDRAAGGPVRQYGFYRVNERGFEMLTVAGEDYLMMGGRPGLVTPHSQIAQELRGGAPEPPGDVHVYVTIDGQQLQGRIERVVRDRDRDLKRRATAGIR